MVMDGCGTDRNIRWIWNRMMDDNILKLKGVSLCPESDAGRRGDQERDGASVGSLAETSTRSRRGGDVMHFN